MKNKNIYILKDVWCCFFFLKLNMHEKNIPGDETETYVGKNRLLSSTFPLLFMKLPTNCLFNQPFPDLFFYFFFFTTYIALLVRCIVLNGSTGTCKVWMEENWKLKKQQFTLKIFQSPGGTVLMETSEWGKFLQTAIISWIYSDVLLANSCCTITVNSLPHCGNFLRKPFFLYRMKVAFSVWATLS